MSLLITRPRYEKVTHYLYYWSDVIVEGRIIGMGLLTYRHTATHGAGSIEDVVVHPDYQGQGIGRALMGTLIAKARDYPGGLEYIDLTSHPSRVVANRLYQSLGFQIRETNCYRLPVS